jgi:hypothetical protein
MRIAFFYMLFFSVSLYAMFRGGSPERSATAAYFSVWVFDKLIHLSVPVEYAEMDPWYFLLDLIAWIAFLAIALRAKRFWPLWIVAVQTISMVAHMAKLMDVSIVPRAYYIMQVASSYPILISFAIGTYCHQRRLKANGTDPAWRNA